MRGDPDLSWLPDLDRESRIVLLGMLENYLQTDQLQDYLAYPKQAEFHIAGRHFRNRMLKAGNQQGKTYAAGAEVAMHLTGEYPPYWQGMRFDRPITVWAAGMTGDATRDNAQRVLLGMPKQVGTGMIPKRLLSSLYGRAVGVADLYDYYMVRHVSGGLSMLKFRFYSQAREKWQGPPVDLVWFDEEPPMPIYMEGIARTIAVQGSSVMTFTPLKGASDVVNLYTRDPNPETSSRHLTSMTIYDALHIPKDKIDAEIARWPIHERQARIMGEVAQGEGLVYPYMEDEYTVDPVDIPPHWTQMAGIDFGGTSRTAHPTAAVKLVHDVDNDIVYAVREYRKQGAGPQEHWLSLRYWGERLKWAWPRDGLAERGEGVQLIQMYRDEGMRALAAHAQFPAPRKGAAPRVMSSILSVERGVIDIGQRIETGRFKIFRTCNLLIEEMRQYHRERDKQGHLRIVKQMDDLVDAMRYAYMMMRYAEVPEPRAFRRRHLPDWQAGA